MNNGLEVARRLYDQSSETVIKDDRMFNPDHNYMMCNASAIADIFDIPKDKAKHWLSNHAIELPFQGWYEVHKHMIENNNPKNT